MGDLEARLRAARGYANLNQTQLGERIGVTKKVILGWEGGRLSNLPAFEREAAIQACADACGLPPQFFYEDFETLGGANGDGQLDRIEEKLDQLLDYFTPRATGEGLEAAAQGAVASLAAALQPPDKRKSA